MNAPSPVVDVVTAAREVRDANRQLIDSRLNGSLHDVSEARQRFARALSQLDDAFGEDG